MAVREDRPPPRGRHPACRRTAEHLLASGWEAGDAVAAAIALEWRMAALDAACAAHRPRYPGGRPPPAILGMADGTIIGLFLLDED